MVDHFERHLRRTRHEVAAYGRGAEDGVGTPEDDVRCQVVATAALERAKAVVEFSADQDDRYLRELRALVVAVGPALSASRLSVSA